MIMQHTSSHCLILSLLCAAFYKCALKYILIYIYTQLYTMLIRCTILKESSCIVSSKQLHEYVCVIALFPWQHYAGISLPT